MKEGRDVFDHVTLDHPAKGPALHDWSHANALDWHSDEGYVLVSLGGLNRIVKILYPSGEVEWTLGADADFTRLNDRWFKGQHNPHRLPNGNLMIYDNGREQHGSRVIELAIDEENRTAEVVWQYPPAGSKILWRVATTAAQSGRKRPAPAASRRG